MQTSVVTIAELERRSGVALWRQIADALRAHIGDGTVRPGAKIPNEVDLAAHYGVNRHTVRRAISVLRAEGILEARRGDGTFVAQKPMSYPLGSDTRFSDIVSGEGRVPHGALLAHETIEADRTIASGLAIASGGLCVQIDSVHTADGIAL
ncbi:MAG: GntR family transcriptional regulator, partial [Pseudomonadota bacterium]